MKTKLLLILTILVAAVSCNSPSNPTTAVHNDVSVVSNTKKETVELNIENDYHPKAVYAGEGKYRINGVAFPDKESIRIEIYDDGSIDVIRSQKYFRFDHVTVEGQNVYKAEKYYNGYTHTLDMTITGDKAKVLYTIQGDNENYTFESDKLVRVAE